MAEPLDFFSELATTYARYRTTYPPELYTRLYEHVTSFASAWDVATGNGQVARDLSRTFENVIATDISQSQLALAPKLPNVDYRIADALDSGLPDDFADLVTVGQAAHWLDFPSFCTEAARVAKPGGVLAIWCYGLFSATPAIDEHMQHFYHEIIGPYWHPRRRLIDNKYRDLNAPFDKLVDATLVTTIPRALGELQGYISSWSAVRNYIDDTSRNPVPDLMDAISRVVKEGDDTVMCKTELYVKGWRIP